MRHARRMFLRQLSFVGMVTASHSAAVWAQSGTNDAEHLTDLRRAWSRSSRYLVEVAQAMPDRDLGYRPVPEVRTFAEQLDHITTTAVGFAGLLRSDPSPPPDASDTGPDVVARLQAGLAYGAEAITSLTVDSASRTVPWTGRMYEDTTRMPLHAVARIMLDHVTHHRGQLVVYLRLRGIVPPAYVD